MKRIALAVAAAVLVAPAAEAQEIYTIATNPQGSQFYTAGAAIAKHLDETLKLQFRVQPSAGSSTYIPLMNRYELNFGFTNIDDAGHAFRGTGNYEGRPNPNMRLIGALWPLTISILVPNDSPVRKIADIKGLRLPTQYASQTIGKTNLDAILANANLTLDDIKPVPVVNLFAGTDALGQGRVDAAPINPPVGQVQKANADLASRGGVRFVSINTDPDSVARMKKVMRSRPMRLEPSPNRVGVLEPTWFLAFDALLAANDKVPDEVVYNVTKSLHAGKAELVKAAPFMADFDTSNMSVSSPMPTHPGAIKFFTEIGQWPPKE